MAYIPLRPRDPLLDDDMQEALEKKGRELLGLLLFALGVALGAALFSHVPNDPSWLAASANEPSNWLGMLGATLAAPLLIILGMGAWGLPLVLLAWGLRLLFNVGATRFTGRILFAPILVVVMAVHAATLIPGDGWTYAFGLGGMFGHTVTGWVVGLFPSALGLALKSLTLATALMILALGVFVLGADRAELVRLRAFLEAGVRSLHLLVTGGVLRGSDSGGKSRFGLGALMRGRDAGSADMQAENHAWQDVPPLSQGYGRTQQAPVYERSPNALGRQPDYAPNAAQNSDPYAGLRPAPQRPHAQQGGTMNLAPGTIAPGTIASGARIDPNLARQGGGIVPPYTPASQGHAPQGYGQQGYGQNGPAAQDAPVPHSEGKLSLLGRIAKRRQQLLTAEPMPPMPKPELVEPALLSPQAAQLPDASPELGDRVQNRITQAIRDRRVRAQQRAAAAQATPAHVAEPPLSREMPLFPDLPPVQPNPARPSPNRSSPAHPQPAAYADPHGADGYADSHADPYADPYGDAYHRADEDPYAVLDPYADPYADPISDPYAAAYAEAFEGGYSDARALDARALDARALDPRSATPAPASTMQAPGVAPGVAPGPFFGRGRPTPTEPLVQHPPRRPMQPSRQAQAEAQPTLQFDEPAAPAFEPPPLSLLTNPANVERHILPDEALEENARMLESVLDDYGIKGEIVSVRPGPVVTMYELEPAPGLKASRVIGLADDIARSMSALSARVSTVPGRSVIGIELPNDNREKVVLREIISSREFGDGNQRLPLALGKDIGGAPVVANLAKMPHLLIAGTTGSGKSVAINTMILSLLYKLTPAECRLIMIDPKMLELSVYDGIPHLLSPVVTDPKKAVVALKWVVGEMEERYRKMSKMGVRNIEGFNSRVRDTLNRGEMFKRTVQTGFDDLTGEPVFETEEIRPETLPYIVVIVDEMADLMMVAGKEIEACIQRLAQMARASGIHLIMATQRPSVDVITGTIKANFPTRISFQVTGKIDSRTILGEQGAEQLLGMGDMLYMAGGAKITRVHGPFVSDEEVEEIVNYLKSYGPPNYVDTVLVGPDDDKADDIDAVLGLGGNTDGEDALYDQAVAVVIKDRKCSTSYIQRKLAIGYNKAARLVEQMEDQGLVSPANHVGKREILVPEH